MINYPNGKKAKKVVPEEKISTRKNFNAANRGMALENDLNLSNEYYRDANLAIITKRPTPIKVVKVDYTNEPKIIEAFFEKQSTTDYNGVYKGRYIDFEAKSVAGKTRFPLANITSYQFKHLEEVIAHGGIAFFIIEFRGHDEVYLLDAKILLDAYYEKKKSLTYEEIKEKGFLVPRLLSPRLDYLPIVNTLYFTE